MIIGRQANDYTLVDIGRRPGAEPRIDQEDEEGSAVRTT
jgi:hypothetical protein